MLGGAVALTDTNGTVQTSYSYEPFGATTNSGVVNKNNYQFTGRENDGTGLYFYRARYYHPGLGRFASEDTLRSNAGANFYVYALNDPILYSDALGMMSWYDTLLNNSSDYAGGFGDFMTGNATHWLRGEFPSVYGENGGVNTCSGYYEGGQISAAALQAALIAAGILDAVEAGLAEPELEGLAGKGIVQDGEVLVHEPIDSVVSHELLAEQSGTLLAAPQAGTAGQLVDGAQAFTYTVDSSGNVLVTGSGNFNSTVSEGTIQAVTDYVRGLQGFY